MFQNRSPIPKSIRRHASGALLLTLLSCGLALQVTTAHAQPTPNAVTTFKPASLSPDQQSELEQVLSISQYEEFCKSALDLKLDDATIEEMITRIKATFPSKKVEIRQRDARPLKVSIDLKETTVGTVLQSVAALADCQLWVFPDGLLIAPPGQLNAAEKKLVALRQAGEWPQSVEAGGHGWSNRTNTQKALALVVAEEVKANNLTPDATGNAKAKFGNFSPQAQKALQQLATWGYTEPFVLAPDSPIEVNLNDPNWVRIDFSSGASTQSGMMAMNIRVAGFPENIPPKLPTSVPSQQR